MKIKFGCIFLLTVFLVACSKPLPEDKLIYTGKWQSKDMELIILSDGSVDYKRLKNGSTTTINAPLKEFKGDNFVVGVGPANTTFEVTQPPQKSDGVWTMVVDGVSLTKVSE